ncbi:MAG: DUF1667 domain-containing protein [Clostridia bacterium]|nr:DUF1667 domain-containing protein [Clostridia bacterium]
MMEQKKVTCVVCPIGCEILVKGDKQRIVQISGIKCKRGEQYAVSEFLNPMRILTTTVKTRNYHLPVVSVRSNKPIPKDLMFECMDALKKVEIESPLEIGQVVIQNILDSGADIVVTKD